MKNYDVAAEIWFHAYAYYHLAPMQAICEFLGFKGLSIWGSLDDGIGIENGLDTKKEMGIPRYQIYRATYAYALANPAMI